MLLTEQNTRTMEKRILKAARAKFGRNNLVAIFEHGQWWIEHKITGAQWSVCDGIGLGTRDGFDFEQVSAGTDD